MKPRDAERSKNFFALGLISLDVHPARSSRRSSGSTTKFGAKPPGARRQPRRVQGRPRLRRDRRAVRPPLRGRSPAALPAGDLHQHHRQHRRWPGASSPPASWPSCRCSSGSYPITPASDILHELSKHKNFGVRTLQAEDEIAGIGAALGAAFGGHLGVTTTSGPGLALKAETMGLAISLELPLLIIDVQRGGPSTGLPTKTEQADLLLAMYGRHGESPLPIVAARSPGALLRRRHRGGPHRAQVPHAGDPALRRLPRQRRRAVAAARRRRRCPTSRSTFATEPNHTDDDGDAGVLAVPARPRDAGPAVGGPGHARASMHRIGGLEKEDGTGNVSYDPENHEHMVAPAGREGRRHRRRHPRRRGRRRRRRRRAARRSAGARPGAPSTAPWAGRGPRAARSPRPTSPTSTRSRRTSARCCALPEGAGARDEPRPAVAAGAGRVPRRRPSGHQGAGRCRSPPARSSRPSSTSLEKDCMTDTDVPVTTRKDCPATRRSAGARAAATTRSSPRCSCSCPSSACAARTRCSSRASAAPPASRTT